MLYLGIHLYIYVNIFSKNQGHYNHIYILNVKNTSITKIQCSSHHWLYRLLVFSTTVAGVIYKKYSSIKAVKDTLSKLFKSATFFLILFVCETISDN